MSRTPPEDLEALVRDATARLVEDKARLWGRAARPWWILACDGIWWLTEAVAGATPNGSLWQVPADPVVGVGSTSVQWRGRTWAMVDCVAAPPTVRLLLHEAFHAFWQPDAWDWVTPAGGGDDSAGGRLADRAAGWGAAVGLGIGARRS